MLMETTEVKEIYKEQCTECKEENTGCFWVKTNRIYKLKHVKVTQRKQRRH